MSEGEDGASGQTGKSNHADKDNQRQGVVRRLLSLVGPGLIAGAAGDDPTGIGTYAQAGASTGYSLLWTTILTLPMMSTVQYMSAKVAVVHKAGLARVIQQHFPKPVVYVAILGLVSANVINAGVDIGATAAAINLIVPIPITVLVLPVAVFILLFLIFGSYRMIQNTFKWLALALLAYIVSSFLSHPNLGEVLKGTVVPRLSFKPAFLSLLVATLGGNVSPYMFFWQADLEVDASVSGGVRVKGANLSHHLRHVALDTNIGMVFSNISVYFIEVATAATLFASGKHNIGSAVQAAAALRPVLGNSATILWAVGIIGPGLLAVPALTGSVADAVATLFGWKRGLSQRVERAKRFYAILGAAMLIGAGVNFLHINPIQALVISATINGFITPPLLVLLLLVANNRDVMGERTNGRALNVLGWGTVLIMTGGAIALLFTL